jgi:hypothetical protein
MSMQFDQRHRPRALAALVGACGFVGLFVGGPAAAISAAASAHTWSIASTPNSTTSDGLNGVTCLSSADCWAVGPASPTAALIEYWNGADWTSVPAAVPTATTALEAVDCVGASDCWAVGRTSSSGSGSTALAEHWNGQSWIAATMPTTPGGAAGLFGVACTNSTDCWTVGSYFTSQEPPATQVLVEHWNGTDWTVVSTPSLPGGQYNFLNATTCSNSTDCWAVGDSANYGKTLAEHWNGRDWSIVKIPKTASKDNVLNGISCVSTSDCWATGQGASGTLAEHWNGKLWSITPTPATGTGNSGFAYGASGLGGSSVACASSQKCWAVGFAGSASSTLVERWNGSKWKVQPTTMPSGSDSSDLNAVACAPGGPCWAVGTFDVSGSAETLAESN